MKNQDPCIEKFCLKEKLHKRVKKMKLQKYIVIEGNRILKKTNIA
ncbi:MAG: hypothetical protein ACFFCS_14250 [Candidatus Hodarchaeota archaeon]